jgi:hypothetical protein
MALIFSG